MPDPDYSAYDMLAPADALAAYLATVTGLAGVPVIVARKKVLQADIDAAVGKAKGAAIMIALDGWTDEIPEGSACHVIVDYSVSIWTKPILRKGAIAESVVLGLLVSALHRYTPVDGDCDYKWTTSTGAYLPHSTHQVYEFPATFPMLLPPVDIDEDVL